MRYQGKQLQSTLDQKVTRKIKQFSQQHSVTVFMTLLATFKVLLSRYSGQTDMVVGSPIANRTHHQTEDLIGLFVNTLVLRTQIEGTQTFPELLKQVRQTALGAYNHQDIPFEYLVEQLNPSRSLSHSPLFQVMFVLQNAPSGELTLSGLKMSLLEPDKTTAKFDLTLSVAEHSDVFVCDWEYNTDLFRPDTITRMTEHFQVLLEGVLNNSEQALSQLPLLTEAEQQQLQIWNQTETDYPKDQTIVDLFQAQVEKTPNNIAVVFEEQVLSFSELNTKANQLAHYLITLGLGAETLVGICVERSVDMVIGLLGILKAGGAYVPLDPNYPKERLQFMLENSELTVLLSQSHLLERLPLSMAKVICLDSELEQIVDYSRENPVRQSGPENLAYVIYTSGSTGVPKGTLLTHKSLSNYLNWALNEYNPTQGSGVPVQSSIAFDATITSLYLPLLSGTRAILLPEKQELDNLAKILRHSNQLSLIKITPAHLEALNQQLEKYAQSTYALIIGGEALTTGQIQPWLTYAPQVRLINEYGPTESVVGCCIYDARGQTDLSSHVPIGRPIANTQIYILDANHNPTPLGIPGELCIAGRGLARGYLNRPSLTSEKFIEIEIFGKHQRIYKTGDLARWLPDGNLEYLGRLDHQVKLRGFRIELGEIEATLIQHEIVKEAVVILHNQEDNPSLVAYVTLDRSIDEASVVLRTWLKTRLPEYMLPANFTVLDKLPLTPNGKINRKALPVPDLAIQAEQQAPRTETEHLLCNLWSQVLGIEVTSILSNFFEAGGHSLLATQLVSRIRESFEIEMPLRVIFEQPLLQEQAEWLDKQQRGSELPPIRPVVTDETLVLSFAQQRLWFLAQLEGQSATYNMPAALHLSGQLNETALQRALTALIQRHDSLRLCFPSVNGEATVQLNEIYNPLSLTDLSELSETEQQRLVTEWVAHHTQTPFYLSTGPLLSLRLACRNKPFIPTKIYPVFWLLLWSKKAWRFLRIV